MNLRGERRTEFSQAVRKKAFARCCINAVPHCENCGIELKPGNIEYEHILPDGLGGEATLENCGVWCRSSCSKAKTHTEDNPTMRKADRVLKRSYDLMPAKQKIASRGFPKRTRTHAGRAPVQRFI